jgi:hypothetical protein
MVSDSTLSITANLTAAPVPLLSTPHESAPLLASWSSVNPMPVATSLNPVCKVITLVPDRAVSVIRMRSVPLTKLVMISKLRENHGSTTRILAPASAPSVS